MRAHSRDERGTVAVLAAAFALAAFAFAAIVVDLGNARDVKQQSQQAADASALAAGNQLYLAGNATPDVTAAVQKAKDYAATNFDVPADAWASCVDPDRPSNFQVPGSSTPCISFRYQGTKVVEVRVRIPDREVSTGFASAFGTDSVAVGTIAQAKLDPGGASRCGLCVIGSGMLHNLQNGDATVHGADIHFNGDVSISANGLVATDGAITVEGSASGPYSNYTPDPTTGAAPITDPLAAVALPAPPSYGGLSAKSGSPCTQGPGIYGSRDLRNSTCTLPSGLYVIAGDSSTKWDLAGNSSTRLLGTGVTLLFTCGTSTAPRACNAGEQGAFLDASGNGFIGITAPTSGSLQGFALIYDRNNNNRVRLTGNGSQNMTGTIYAASGAVQMNGNGCSVNYFSLIVVRDLEMNGNPACLQSTYNQNQNAQVPPGIMHLSR